MNAGKFPDVSMSHGTASFGRETARPGVAPQPFYRTETISQRGPWFVHHAEKSRPHCLVLAHANVVWGTNPTNQSFEKRFKGTLNMRPLWARPRVGQTGTLVDPLLGLDLRAAWLTFSDAIPLANLGCQSRRLCGDAKDSTYD